MQKILIFLLIVSATVISAQQVITISQDPLLNGGIATDSRGTLYIAHSGSNGILNGKTIYRLDRDGNTTSYINGLTNWPIELDFGVNDTLFATSWFAQGVYSILPGGSGSQQIIGGIPGANGMEIDLDTEEFYVMSFTQHAVYKVQKNGTPQPFASGGSIFFPAGIARDVRDGSLYITNWQDGRITRVLADGSKELFVTLNLPGGTGMPACLIRGNDLIVTTYAAHQIFQVNLNSRTVVLLAGDGQGRTKDGSFAEASFLSPGPMTLNATGDTLYVTQDSLATTTGAGRGAVRALIFADTTSIPADIGSPSSGFQLRNNYPNPFNPQTTIEFYLPVTAVVSLDIYNVMGQRVVGIYRDKPLLVGVHNWIWNATDNAGNAVASGVYYYRLAIDHKINLTKKMILLR